MKLCRESGRSPDTIGKELDLSGSLPAARDEESCSESVSDDWGRDESNEDMLNRMCEKYDGGSGPTGPDSDRQRCLEGSRNYQKMREYCIKGGIVPPKLR